MLAPASPEVRYATPVPNRSILSVNVAAKVCEPREVSYWANNSFFFITNPSESVPFCSRSTFPLPDQRMFIFNFRENTNSQWWSRSGLMGELELSAPSSS